MARVHHDGMGWQTTGDVTEFLRRPETCARACRNT